MLYLSEITVSNGPQGVRPLTPREFNYCLSNIAQDMYQKGWTVIGSVCKKPALHPWSKTSKEVLLQLTLQDLNIMRANALNVRLKDSNVVALDCDIHNPDFMKVYLSKVMLLFGLRKDQLYTTVGGKGGKIFFRVTPKQHWREQLAKAFCYQENSLQPQQEMIEIKTHLSTVAGRYNAEFALYHPYPGTQFICSASPQQLPFLTHYDLPVLKRIFLELSCDWGYVDSQGQLTAGEWLKYVLPTVLAKFYLTNCPLPSAYALKPEWESFCRLQGSSVYRDAIMACFYHQWPKVECPSFSYCKECIINFKKVLMSDPNTIEDLALNFDSTHFRSYANYLCSRLLSERVKGGDNLLDTYRIFGEHRRNIQTDA